MVLKKMQTCLHMQAAENLVPYSKTEPSIFKSNQLIPVKDLKLLVKDYTVLCHPLAENKTINGDVAYRHKRSYNLDQHFGGPRCP